MKVEDIKLAFENNQKFEFALLDNSEKELSKIYEDINRSKTILSNAGNQAEAILKNSILKANNNIEQLTKGEQMAKELGVDISKISALKARSQSSISTANEILKSAQNALKV
jgi:hypothetical protein